MKIKRLFSIICVMVFSLFCIMLCGAKTVDKNPQVVPSIETPTAQIEADKEVHKPYQDTWCVTFQLVWNEFMDKVTGGKRVEFEGGNPPIADELNKRLYTKDILSEKSYFIAQGKATKSLKKHIEKSIKKKFNEKSDILGNIVWNDKTYLFYAMLKKDFTFLTPFDRLDADKFNNSDDAYKFFGITKHSKKKLKENVKVLFYTDENEYAVKLLTNENEEVILFRTDKDDTLENHYAYVLNKADEDKMGHKDELKVPDLIVDKLISYNELCNKKIKGTNIVITQALQTIKFKMDNKGGSLKSEAAIAVMKAAFTPDPDKPKYFYFDKPFVLFLLEKGKEVPYYAMTVKDTEYLVKSEK